MKEKQKQHLIDMMQKDEELGLYDEPKQETLEEVRKVERTELFDSIHSVVKQIPRKDGDGDAMDVPSCAYELEQLFYKWQQERSYSEEEVYNLVLNAIKDCYDEELNHHYDGDYRNLKQWFEQFKKK